MRGVTVIYLIIALILLAAAMAVGTVFGFSLRRQVSEMQTTIKQMQANDAARIEREQRRVTANRLRELIAIAQTGDDNALQALADTELARVAAREELIDERINALAAGRVASDMRRLGGVYQDYLDATDLVSRVEAARRLVLTFRRKLHWSDADHLRELAKQIGFDAQGAVQLLNLALTELMSYHADNARYGDGEAFQAAVTLYMDVKGIGWQTQHHTWKPEWPYAYIEATLDWPEGWNKIVAMHARELPPAWMLTISDWDRANPALLASSIVTCPADDVVSVALVALRIGHDIPDAQRVMGEIAWKRMLDLYAGHMAQWNKADAPA